MLWNGMDYIKEESRNQHGLVPVVHMFFDNLMSGTYHVMIWYIIIYSLH